MLTWSDLVNSLQLVMDDVFSVTVRLLTLFVTPFSEIIESSDTGLSSWVTNTITFILDLFGVDFLSLTPLEFMFGSLLPFIVVFTIYRYVKQ